MPIVSVTAAIQDVRFQPRRKISTVLDAIHSNLQGSLRAAEMARQANLSVFRFLHVFKETTGESFGRYCNRLRMEKVKELLQAGDQDLESIAAEVGMSSGKALSYHFKKVYLVPPSRYRKLFASPAPHAMS